MTLSFFTTASDAQHQFFSNYTVERANIIIIPYVQPWHLYMLIFSFFRFLFFPFFDHDCTMYTSGVVYSIILLSFYYTCGKRHFVFNSSRVIFRMIHHSHTSVDIEKSGTIFFFSFLFLLFCAVDNVKKKKKTRRPRRKWAYTWESIILFSRVDCIKFLLVLYETCWYFITALHQLWV